MYPQPKQDAYGDYFGGRAHNLSHKAAWMRHNPDMQQKSAAQFVRALIPR